MKNSVFSIANLQISIGTTVKWVNDDNTTHTVSANNGSFNSGDLAPGASYSRIFSTVVTFPYHCMHHPQMTGTVVVGASMSGGGY